MDVVTPTCNKGGYTRMACQDCGFHQQILPTPPTGFHSIPEWRDMGEAGHAGVCRDCEKSFIKEHDMAWTPAASGAHTGRCTACGFKRAVPALGCDIRMPGIFVALGHTITPAWTLSGGLPPYKILACYVKTRQEGALPHQDLVHHGGQASFTPDAGAGTAVDFVLRFRDSLGAVFQHSASFFVTSGQSFDVDLELPDNVATGDSITATWHLSQAVDPVHVAGLWSVYEGDNLLDSAPCADRNNTCTFAPAAGSRGVLTLRFEDAAGRTVEETRPFTITQPVQTPAPVLVEGIELTGQLQLTTGSAHKLHARVFPDHADTRGLHWSSSDDSIAKVNQEGTVIALAPGQATITASTTDGSGITAACLVTVIRPALPGDADNNQQVDVKDLMRMVDFLVMGSPVPSPDNANLVSDGEELHINLEDILKLIAMIVGS